MKIIKNLIFAFALLSTWVYVSCDENGDFVIFSIQNDMELGAEMDAQIEGNPDEFPILSRSAYPDAYNYLDDMVTHILDEANITYRDEFAWEVHIIDQDILNAFVTPGGYIYVYRGLIQYLDEADDLAGVIGHEIAHADQRHSSKQLQRQYGISILLSVILGDDPSTLEAIVAQIAGTGAVLQFSRDAEAEADDFSVRYLAETRYACNGAATFFQKLLDEGQGGGVPEFLSTHPSPDNRVEDINARAERLGCSTDNFADNENQQGISDYDRFKNDWLP
jgi:predicted Zn-dependent protease